MEDLAVLTGDIVNSTALPPEALDTVLLSIQTASQNIALWATQPNASFFARRGGDSWQIALHHPELALRAALFVQASVAALTPPASTRIAIAVGPGTVPANGDLNAAHGPAFTESGRALGQMSGSSLMAVSSLGAPHAAALLADHISQGWTTAQARAATLALAPNPPTQAAIAEILGITRQAVNQALQSAAVPTLRAALKALEQDGGDK